MQGRSSEDDLTINLVGGFTYFQGVETFEMVLSQVDFYGFRVPTSVNPNGMVGTVGTRFFNVF